MEDSKVEKLISSVIEKEAANAKTATHYRQPLVGFTEVRNDDFYRLREIVGTHHLLPEDILEGAQSLVGFFLPFSEDVVDANLRSDYIAREWVVAYRETNNLISHICEVLVHTLNEAGIEAAFEQPTYDFDKRKLVARWSHKSIARLIGLGSFGLNKLLITDAGCAGRFGSLLVSTKLNPTPAEQGERCLYFYDKSCKLCIERCPVNAIKADGSFDGESCHQYLKKVDTYFNDVPSTEACGKCSVGLPCSLHSGVRTMKTDSK